MKISDSFSKELIYDNENETVLNVAKNIYLQLEDVSEIKIINKNEMICDNKKYKINEYINEINSNYSTFLEDSKYNYCKNCKKNINKYFCRNCNKNLCEKCFEDFKCSENEHTTFDLDGNIKQINLNNIKEIKSILNNNIIHIKEDDEIIKKIVQYIDKYIINKNSDDIEDLLLMKISDNQELYKLFSLSKY